jgi:hypothetical protein
MTSQPYTFYTSDPTQMQQYLQEVLGSTGSSDDIAQVRTLVSGKVLPLFNNMLMSTLMLNTSYNSTKYVADDVKAKQLDASIQEQRLRNNISKVRYSFIQKKYIVSYNNFISGCIQGAIIVFSISAILIGLWFQERISSTIAAIIIGIVVITYLIMVAVLVSNNMYRRKDDWNKFYFGPYDPSSANT